jgi:hypothetical protein
METNKEKKTVQSKSIRQGWQSISKQNPKRLADVAGNGIKVSLGMYSHYTDSSKLLIP